MTFNPLALSARASVRGAAAVRAARKANATAKKAAFIVRASDEDLDFMGEIGLGEEMEDMLAKAAGGRSVPKFIEDLGIEPLTGAFKFLGSDQMTGPGSEMLFVEKFGETLYREAGFTETAEKINGRLAVRSKRNEARRPLPLPGRRGSNGDGLSSSSFRTPRSSGVHRWKRRSTIGRFPRRSVSIRTRK